MSSEYFQKLRMKECMRVRSNITLEEEWTEDAKNQRNRVEKSVRFLFLLISSLYAALDLEVDEGLPMKNKENETYELFSVEGYSGMQEPDVSVHSASSVILLLTLIHSFIRSF